MMLTQLTKFVAILMVGSFLVIPGSAVGSCLLDILATRHCGPHCHRDQLLSLPGVTAAEADRVIAGRPYGEPGEVVTRRIMPKTEYDKIADRVTAKK